MNELLQAAADVQRFFAQRRWKFAFIGGFALQHWGEPRTTRDVDLTLLTGFGDEAIFIREILTHFKPRSADAAKFALRSRVLLVQSGEVGVDISLGAIAYEQAIIERSREVRFAPKVKVRLCSAEDLIVLKAFASRDQDWSDIKGVIIRQRKLDWRLIETSLEPLLELKEEPEIWDRLQALRKEVKGNK